MLEPDGDPTAVGNIRDSSSELEEHRNSSVTCGGGGVWVEELFPVRQTCPFTDMLLSDRGDRSEDICERSSLI